MSKPSSHKTARLEALLFASPEPLPAAKLATLMDISEEEILRSITALKADLKQRGIGVVEARDGFELAVQPAYRSDAATLTQMPAPNLSQSSLEVLTIIAYEGPVAKSVIDDIRGTPSDNSLRALMSRDLVLQISERESDDVLKYEPTSFAWRCLGIHGRSELPPKPKETRDASE